MGDTSLATSRLSLFRLALLLGSIVLAICLYHSETSYRYIAGVSRVHRIISAGNGTDDTTTNLRPATTLDPRNGSNSDRGYKTLWKDKYNMTEWTLENQGGAAFSRYPHFYGPTQNINKFSLRMHMCRGPEYDALATRLRAYADDTARHGPDWGRLHSRMGLPDNSRILVFGNSHTRQAAFAWMAQQMPHGVVKVTKIFQQFAVRVDLINNATMYILANTYVAYSGSRWLDNLKLLTDNSALEDFDAVIVGFVNGCGNQTLSKFTDIPGLDCDFHRPEPEN